MKEMQFSTKINTTKEKVWNTLWSDETFRQWAGVLDPGTYMTGDMREGNEVQFISAENGYGVTSLIDTLIPNEFLVLKHKADTQDAGARERENEWTGGTESYRLTEEDRVSTLTFVCDVPEEMEEYFKEAYPKAFHVLKELSEKNKE